MYIYKCIYIYLYLYVCTCTYLNRNTHAYMHIYIGICVYTIYVYSLETVAHLRQKQNPLCKAEVTSLMDTILDCYVMLFAGGIGFTEPGQI